MYIYIYIHVYYTYRERERKGETEERRERERERERDREMKGIKLYDVRNGVIFLRRPHTHKFCLIHEKLTQCHANSRNVMQTHAISIPPTKHRGNACVHNHWGILHDGCLAFLPRKCACKVRLKEKRNPRTPRGVQSGESVENMGLKGWVGRIPRDGGQKVAGVTRWSRATALRRRAPVLHHTVHRLKGFRRRDLVGLFCKRDLGAEIL